MKKRLSGIIYTSTLLNLFLKFLNYIFYLMIGIYFGASKEFDAINYIEGIFSFTILLPMVFLGFSFPKIAIKKFDDLKTIFSSTFAFTFIWSIIWGIILFSFIDILLKIFYPGLPYEIFRYVISNKIYILGWCLFVLNNALFSMFLDVIKKHLLVYIVLIFKALVSIYLVYCKCISSLFSVFFISSMVEFLLYLPYVVRYASFNFSFEYVRSLFKGLQFVVLFVIVGHIFGLIDRFFISYLPKGTLSVMKYASLIQGVISTLFPISRILYPYLVSESSRDRISLFLKTLKPIAYFYIVFVIFLMMYPTFLPRMLFGIGKFSEEQLKLMGFLTIILSLTALVGLFISVVDKLLYLEKIYKALYLRLIATIVINGLGDYLSVFVFDWGIIGIQFFTFLMHIFILISSYTLLKQKIVIEKREN